MSKRNKYQIKPIDDEIKRVSLPEETLSDDEIKQVSLLRETLSIAKKIENEFARIQSLIGLAVYLPEALVEALLAIEALENDDSKYLQVLMTLTLHSKAILPQTLDSLKSIQDKVVYAQTLIVLIVSVREIEDSLKINGEIEQAPNYAQNSIVLAPSSQEISSEMLKAIKILKDKPEFAQVLITSQIALIPYFQEVSLEALDSIKALKGKPELVQVLIALSPNLPQNVILQALEMTMEIEDESERIKVLIILLPKIVKLSTEILIPIWQNSLHLLSCQSRKILLKNLVALLQVTPTLHTQEVITEIIQAIQHVGRWWP